MATDGSPTTHVSTQPFSATPPPPFRASVAANGVIYVSGELDLATRDQLVSVVTAGRRPAVEVYLGGCTFMDCSGYGALVASRLAIEGQGRSLTITGQTGQPALLWKLIADLERDDEAATREGQLQTALNSRVPGLRVIDIGSPSGATGWWDIGIRRDARSGLRDAPG